MNALDPNQMVCERAVGRGRQYGHPILVSLPTVHGQLPRRKVDVLHPQLQSLEEAQPRPVEKHPDEPRGPLQASEHALGLLARQHHRQPARHLRPYDTIDPHHGVAEYLPVQEEDRAQRLVLGRGSDAPASGETR